MATQIERRLGDFLPEPRPISGQPLSDIHGPGRIIFGMPTPMHRAITTAELCSSCKSFSMSREKGINTSLLDVVPL